MKRSEIIDGFRGVAILAVMGYHYLSRWRPPENPVDVYGYTQFDPVMSWGFTGVNLFFIVSGLVITMTVLASADPVEFAVKRMARLYPAFLVIATALFVLFRLYDPLGWKVGLIDYLANPTFVANDVGRKYVDGAFWSLAVEVKFYAMVALSFAILRRRFWIAIIVLALLGAVLAPFHHRIANVLLIAPYMPLFLIGMGLWFGVLEKKFIPGAACLIAGLGLYPVTNNLWWGDMFVLGGGGVMGLLLWLKPDAPMGPLAWIGRISYSLYLLHQRLGVTIIHELKLAGLPDLVAVGTACLTVVLLAWLSFRFVEGPGRRLVMALYRSGRERLRSPRPAPVGV